MSDEQFLRTEMLIGNEALNKLKRARVAVFGVGGVGGTVCEALIRGGIGSIDIVDDDKVSVSNLNRQIIALKSTVGKDKVEVCKNRLLDINEEAVITAHKCFFTPETSDKFNFSEYDYVVDAIDTVTGKIELILKAKENGVPVISAMGAGNKLDPTAFTVDDIYKTSVCPLARVMRKELKARGVKGLKVVYSKEVPISSDLTQKEEAAKTPTRTGKPKKSVPGSVSFVPAVMGFIIAGEVIKDLIKQK